MNCSLSPGKNARQPGLNGRRCARRHQRRVSLGQLQHFGDAISGGDFQFGDTHKVAAGLGHDRFKFGTKNGTAEDGHGSFAVDDGLYSKLLVGIARLAEPAYLAAAFPGEELARRHQ